ncbi:MAG: LysE family transporter [Candidatus Thermoplasmatota archaeon]|nr:LysE family transporter [Candidatus Thermoplasmatota archaeon]
MDIEYDALVGLLTILAVGIFTPGPNNITAISHSAVHGARSNISLLIGMVIGFISVHLIIGSVVEQIDEESVFFSFLEWFGILFFVALGIIILRLPIERLSVDQEIQKLDFRHGIALQFINGKEWAFVSVMMIQFLDGFGGGLTGILLITSITTTAGLLSMILWTFTGHKLMATLRDERKGTIMIRCLAGAIFVFAAAALFAMLF